jgi:hypothetical protein
VNKSLPVVVILFLLLWASYDYRVSALEKEVQGIVNLEEDQADINDKVLAMLLHRKK